MGKALFPLPGRVIHQCCLQDFSSVSCRVRLWWGWRLGGDGCPRSREAARAQHQSWAPSRLLSALPWVLGQKKEKKSIFKDANGSTDIVMSKLKSSGKLLCVNVAFVDVLSSKYLLFSICIVFPKSPLSPVNSKKYRKSKQICLRLVL